MTIVVRAEPIGKGGIVIGNCGESAEHHFAFRTVALALDEQDKAVEVEFHIFGLDEMKRFAWSTTDSGRPRPATGKKRKLANGDGAGDRTIINPAGVGLTATTVTPVCNFGPGGATSTGDCDPNHADDKNVGGDPTPADAFTVGYLAVNPKGPVCAGGSGCPRECWEGYRQHARPQHLEHVAVEDHEVHGRASLQFRFQTFDTFNHQNYSIGLPSNNGTLDQNANTNPLNTSYIFVTSSQFLNKFIFSGGSRNLELGLRFSW